MEGATVPGAAEPYGREGLDLKEARQRVLDAMQPLNRSESLKLAEARGRISAETPVSYTHLTLPTTPYV